MSEQYNWAVDAAEDREEPVTVCVKTDVGLDHMSIEMIQAIEKDCDKTMLKYGFSRTTTSKAGQEIELNYHRFVVANG